MKQIALSDHASGKAERFAEDRRIAHKHATERHQRARIEREALVRQRSEERAASPLLRVLDRFIKPDLEKDLLAIGNAPRLAEASDEERAWQAGREGEQKVALRLSEQFDDAWTFVTGFRGPKGEIDGILCGPRAIVAFEIKHVSGMVHVDGDVWRREKPRHRDNIFLKSQPIADRTGRSPSQQINATADHLQQLLRNRVGPVGVHRVVVLSHDRCVLGSIASPTVHGIVKLDQLDGRVLVRQLPETITVEFLDSVLAQLTIAHLKQREVLRSR